MTTATNETPTPASPPAGNAANSKLPRSGCLRAIIGIFAVFVLTCAGGVVYHFVSTPKDLTLKVLLGISRLNPQSPNLSLQTISKRYTGKTADRFLVVRAYGLPVEYSSKNYSWFWLELWFSHELSNAIVATRGDRAIWYAEIPRSLVPDGPACITPIGDTLTLPSGQMSTIQVQYQILETTAPQVTRFNDLMR